MPAEVDEGMWSWWWGPQGGAAFEHGFWDNPFYDCIRILVIIGGMMMAFYSIRAVAEQRRREQKMSIYQECRFIALALAGLALASTEAWLMGTVATPRLLIHVAIVVLGFLGVYGKRKQQKTEKHDTVQDLT